MHIEQLGEKTYLMSIDPDQIEHDDIGNARLTFMNGSTETRLNIAARHLSEMIDTPFMAIVTGSARLNISINEEFNIVGYEEMDVDSIELSSVALREIPYAECIPF